MFNKSMPLAIFMQDSLNTDYGKMGFGVMRYTDHPVACVLDTNYTGQTVRSAVGQPFDIPVVSTIAEAAALGSEILVLGTAPSGGRFPDAWVAPVEEALSMGMSLVNGLHDRLADRFSQHIQPDHASQKIWDVRQPTFVPTIAMARAASLPNKRVLMVGTDMAVGKMTTGLEVYRWVQEQGISTDFIATGQIGITVTGRGVPLDAVIVDQAAGAIETLVLESQHHDIVFIEGQGSLLHPGSTATLPLMRGSCATHLILCHRAFESTLRNPSHIKIPSLREFIKLNEDLTAVCGSLTRADCIGVSLNTYGMTDEDARQKIDAVEQETGLPATDVIRYGADKLGQAIITS